MKKKILLPILTLIVAAGAYFYFYIYPSIKMSNKLEQTKPYQLGELYDEILSSPDYWLEFQRVQDTLIKQGEKLWYNRYYKGLIVPQQTIPPKQRKGHPKWEARKTVFESVPDHNVWEKYLKILSKLDSEKSLEVRVKLSSTNLQGYDVLLDGIKRDAEKVFRKINSGELSIEHIDGAIMSRQLYCGLSSQDGNNRNSLTHSIKTCRNNIKQSEWSYSLDVACMALMEIGGDNTNVREWLPPGRRNDKTLLNRVKDSIEELKEYPCPSFD